MQSISLIILSLSTAGAISHFPLLLVVSFDGFWAGYLEKYREETPNLHNLAASGVTTPWMENVFITTTFPNHHSIATGLYEENHGIVANIFYDPVLKEKFNYADSTESKWWDTGPVPIWIVNQLADPNRVSGGMMWPGITAPFRNETAFYKIEYNNKTSDKKKIDTVIDWFTNSTNPANCIFLYFEMVDTVGHNFGPNSEEMRQAVKSADESVGVLVERLKEVDLFKKVNLVILSDHGMAEVLPGNYIDLSEILNRSVVVEGNGAVLSVYPNEDEVEIIYQILKNASANLKFTVYKKNDIPDEFHYKNNPRIPPILIVADEGYEVSLHRRKGNESHPHGNHGYNNTVASMHAFFIAHGPAFKSGVVIPPFRNIDLYSLLCHVLQVIPGPNDGSLPNVIGMLKDPFGLHVTNKWLIAICAVLGICLLLAVFAAFFTNSAPKATDSATDDSFPARLFKKDKTTSGEEKTYLLVSPTATENL